MLFLLFMSYSIFDIRYYRVSKIAFLGLPVEPVVPVKKEETGLICSTGERANGLNA